MFSLNAYYIVAGIMIVLAVITFTALHRITAPYGMAYSSKWGPSVPNRAGWVLMEAPSFIGMLLMWLLSPRANQTAPAVMVSLFLLHYFQRSFIFPLLIKGRSRMPLLIVAMGVTFNLINVWLIGGWLFYLAPPGYYTDSWLCSPLFILGSVIFIAGMWINLQSDYIIRHLRRPGDTRHYIPSGGMFRYVTSANYLGELMEWLGFAILTWSLAGLVFFIWTFANLAPRARSLHGRYIAEFGDEYRRLRRRYLIPYIY